MLKRIPRIISPELLFILSRMGHGDEVLLADANFPSASVAKEGGVELVRADGHGCLPLLEAVVQLLPIDTYDPTPVTLMEVCAHEMKIILRSTLYSVMLTP